MPYFKLQASRVVRHGREYKSLANPFLKGNLPLETTSWLGTIVYPISFTSPPSCARIMRSSSHMECTLPRLPFAPGGPRGRS